MEYKFYKVSEVESIGRFNLKVKFENGITKRYDVNPLFNKWKIFNELKNNNLFEDVKVDTGGYGISWNDDIDLSCNELYENGKEM